MQCKALCGENGRLAETLRAHFAGDTMLLRVLKERPDDLNDIDSGMLHIALLPQYRGGPPGSPRQMSSTDRCAESHPPASVDLDHWDVSLTVLESVLPRDWQTEGTDRASLDQVLERVNCKEDAQKFAQAVINIKCVPSA